MDLRETLRAALRDHAAINAAVGKDEPVSFTATEVAALLAALDELDALKGENAEADVLNTKLSRILTDTAHALKGTPEALHSHSWGDLAQVAARLVDERDAIKGENARLVAQRKSYGCTLTRGQELEQLRARTEPVLCSPELLVQMWEWREKGEADIATLRAELADLRERAGRLHTWARSQYKAGGQGSKQCAVCMCWTAPPHYERPEAHREGCICAPGFLDAKEGGR